MAVSGCCHGEGRPRGSAGQVRLVARCHSGKEDSDAIRRLAAVVPVTTEPMRILGMEAGDEYQLVLWGSEKELAAAAGARAKKCTALFDGIRQIVNADMSAPVLSAAWTLLVKCASTVFDYDARLVPVPELTAVMGGLDEQILGTRCDRH